MQRCTNRKFNHYNAMRNNGLSIVKVTFAHFLDAHCKAFLCPFNQTVDNIVTEA